MSHAFNLPFFNSAFYPSHSPSLTPSPPPPPHTHTHFLSTHPHHPRSTISTAYRLSATLYLNRHLPVLPADPPRSVHHQSSPPPPSGASAQSTSFPLLCKVCTKERADLNSNAPDPSTFTHNRSVYLQNCKRRSLGSNCCLGTAIQKVGNLLLYNPNHNA